MNAARLKHFVRTTTPLIALPVIGLFVGLVAAVITTALLPTTYKATASVIVLPTPTKDTNEIRLSDVSLAQNLVSSVSQLTESRDVATSVAAALQLPIGEVDGHLKGVSQILIQIVTIEATASSGAQAAAMANTATTAIVDLSARLNLGGATVSVQALDLAGVPGTPTSPRPLLNDALGALVGLLIGIGAVSLRTRLSDRFRRVADVERELGLPTLGLIRRRASARGHIHAADLYARPDVGPAVDSLVSVLGVLVGRPSGRRIVVTSVADEATAIYVADLLTQGLMPSDDDGTGDDVVLVAPSVLAGRGTWELAQGADVVILTLDSDRVGRAEAGRAAQVVQRLGVPVAGVVVTGSAANEDGRQPSVWPALTAPTAAGVPARKKKAPASRAAAQPELPIEGAP